MFISAGTYFYAKVMGLSRVSAFYSGLIFTFSGFLIGHLRHVSVISSLSFMPLSFFLLEKILSEYGQKKIIISSRLIVWYLLLAILTAFSILAGHLTTVYLELLVLTSYFSLRVYFKVSKLNKHFWLLILSFFSSLFLSLLLSAIQLLPTWLLFLNSTRSALNSELYFDKSIAIAYHFKFLVLFLSPYIFGDPSKGTWPLIPEQNYWENIGYIGLLPLVLSIIGLFIGIKTKDIKIKITGVLIFFSFLLLLGKNTFFFKLFWDLIPGFNLLRISGRFLLIIDFFLSLIGGFGLLYLEKKITYLKKPIITLIIILTIADLFWFGIGFNNVISLDYFKPNQTSQFLDQDKSFFRIRSVNADKLWIKAWFESKGWRDNLTAYFAHRQTLPADFNQLFRIPSTDSIYGVSYHFSVRRSNELDSFIIEPQRLLDKPPRLSLLLGMENVKYLILPGAYNQDPDLKLVKKISGNIPSFDVYIYKNSLWLPRAYLVGKPIYVTDDDQLLNQMFDKFEPSKEVLLSKKLDIPETSGKGSVQINHYDNDNVLISAFSQDGGFLVLSDTYYPGWKAYVDGKEITMLTEQYI
ncbi:hypothetical protein HY025_03230 [Candidatus Daviesbacteria bacterium]|nr:hypothetical protein [Candidatus Daviesbacteria bacterium]